MELEILENTKMLLGIEDDAANALLLFLIKDTADAVMSYCRIAIVPNQLYGLIAQIAAEIYRSRGYESPGTSRTVKSVTEGERRVEFESTVSYFDNYISRLEPFVNKSARLPSEMNDKASKSEDISADEEFADETNDISADSVYTSEIEDGLLGAEV